MRGAALASGAKARSVRESAAATIASAVPLPKLPNCAKVGADNSFGSTAQAESRTIASNCTRRKPRLFPASPPRHLVFAALGSLNEHRFSVRKGGAEELFLGFAQEERGQSRSGARPSRLALAAVCSFEKALNALRHLDVRVIVASQESYWPKPCAGACAGDFQDRRAEPAHIRDSLQPY